MFVLEAFRISCSECSASHREINSMQEGFVHDKHITKSRTIDNDEHLIIILILIGDLNA